MYTVLPVKKANLLYLISMLLVISIGAWLQSLSFSIGLLLTEVFCILLPSLLFLRANKIPVQTSLKIARSRGSILLVSFILGVGSWMTGVLIDSLMIQFSSHQVDSGSLILPTNLFQAFFVFLGFTVAAPLCEEFLFRGILQTSYQKEFGALTAIGIVGLLFALFHLRFQGLPALIPIALVLGYTYWRTGSLWNSMAVHFGNNFLAASVLVQAGLFPGVKLPFINGPTLILGVFLLAVGIVLLTRLTSAPASTVPAQATFRPNWGSFWPVLGGLIIFGIAAVLELLNGSPPKTLNYQLAAISSPLTFEYQLLDKAGTIQGSAHCQLNQTEELQSLICERTNQAFELQIGNSYFSSMAGSTDLKAEWLLNDLALRSMQITSSFAGIDSHLQVAPNPEGLSLQVNSDNNTSQPFIFMDTTLVSEEWPFRLMHLDFEGGDTWLASYLEPLTWREKTSDNGPLLTKDLVLRKSVEAVDVPAGTFSTWKVQLSNGQTAWFDQNPPFLPVKISLGIFDYVLLSWN